MKKFFQMGGVIAGAFLVLFGIGAIVIGFAGKAEVRDNIAREAIVGTPDMTPSAIKSEAAKAGLNERRPADVQRRRQDHRHGRRGEVLRELHAYPHARGDRRLHVLADGPLPGTPDGAEERLAVGGGTDNATYAVTDAETTQPVANGARDLWVTETALTTALNTSFFAERVALFSITVGFALLLTGIGFLVLAYLGVLRRKEAAAAEASRPRSPQRKSPPRAGEERPVPFPGAGRGLLALASLRSRSGLRAFGRQPLGYFFDDCV